MGNFIDPAKAIVLEDGTQMEVVNVSIYPARVLVRPLMPGDKFGASVRKDRLERFAVSGYWYDLYSGHFAGHIGDTNYNRIRNVGKTRDMSPYSAGEAEPRGEPVRHKDREIPVAVPQVYVPGASPSIRGHGGGCCGTSHLYSFGNTGPMNANDPTKIGHTYEQQCRLAIATCKHQRGSGLMEAILKDNQKKDWHDILESEGFKLVNDFVNSNTHNRLWVYHYVYGASNGETVKKVSSPFGK